MAARSKASTMGDVLGFLCVLAIVLAITTVVGHGIWVALAWVFRTLSGDDARWADQGKPCTSCGARFGVRQGRCVVCGAVPGISPGSALRDELTTTARQLRRLLDRGAITPEQYDALAAVISADLQSTGGTAGLPSRNVVQAPQTALLGKPAVPQPPSAGSKLLPEGGESAVHPGASEPALVPANEPVAAEAVEAIIIDDTTERGAGVLSADAGRRDARPTTSPEPGLTPADVPFAPAQPARGLGDMLQSFMEESNIRWGEILAALLIVVSSVGLVVSLRAKLQAIPYAPALIFALFTVLFHGAGLYTLRRWKLQAVSRVVLIISLLLVPLAVSGAVVMSGSGEAQRPVTDPLFLAAVLIGTAAFGWVTYSASSELVGEARWRLTFGILACSLSQIAIQRVGLADLSFWRLNAVLALPLTGFLVAAIGQLVRASGKPRLSRPRIVQTLLVLGTVTFAFLAPLILILMRSEPRWLAVARLSPGLSLAAAAVLALGLLIHRRTLAKSLVAYQTAGTAILIFAGALLLMFVGFTWPDPELLVTVGIINCVVLAALGFVSGLPLLYAPAVACAALASVIGLHLAQGRFDDERNLSLKVVQAILMGRSSLALSGLAIAVAGIGGWALTRSRRQDGRMLLASTGGLAAVALVIAFVSGFVPLRGWPQDRDLAAGVLLFYALALLVAAPRLPWPAVAGVGSFLLWTALVQALWLNHTCRDWLGLIEMLPDRPIFVATLTHGVLTAFASLALVARSFTPTRSVSEGGADSTRDVPQGQARLPVLRLINLTQPNLTQPLAIGAAISLLLVLPAVLWVWNGLFNWHAIFALIAALGWAALAAAQRWKWAISGLQAMLAIAPALFVAGAWHSRIPTRDWIVHEQHLLSQLTLLALGGIVWSVVRRVANDPQRAPRRNLLHASWPAVDQVLLAVAAVALPLLALVWTLPAAGWELGFNVPAPVTEAGVEGDLIGTGGRGWIALLVVLTSLLVALWERINIPALVGLGIASFAAVWLAAEPFQEQAAAASAVRWAAAIYGAVWGAAFIARKPLRYGAKRLPWLRWDAALRRRSWPGRGPRQAAPGFALPEFDPRFAADWFCAQPLVLGGLTILAITIVAVSQNVSGSPPRGPMPGSIFEWIGLTPNYAGPLLAMVAVLLGYGIRERSAAFALGGSGVFQLAINLAFMLYVTKSPAQPVAVRAIEWLQWNSLAAGVYALVWLGLWRWITPATTPQPSRFAAHIMLDVQIAVAAATAAALAVWAAWAIFLEPGALPSEIVPLGGLLSYLAAGIVLAALVARQASALQAIARQASGGRQPPEAIDIAIFGDLVIGVLVGLIALLAASAHQLDLGGQWIAYHTLTAGWIVIGAVACALACVRSKPFLPHHASAAAIAALVILLAIRGNQLDPLQPWWSLGATLASFGIATTLGLAFRSQLYAYASTALAGIAVVLYWLAPASQIWNRVVFANTPAPADAVALAIAGAAGLWLSREIASQRRRNESLDAWFAGPRVHVLAIVGILPLYFLVRLGYAVFFNHPGVWFVDTLSGFPAYSALAIAATLSLGAVVAAMLWDRRAFVTLPAAYVWGGVAWLLAIGLASRWLPEIEHRVVAVFAALALHVALSGQIWSYGANLAAWGTKAGISDPIGGLSRTVVWLPMVSVLLAGLVCIVNLIFVLALELDYLRVTAALGPAIAAWGVLCLAQERRKSAFQLAALLMLGLAAIYLGWAQIDPYHTPAVWLIRVFRLVMVLAALTFLYGLALPRWLLTSGSWNDATRKAGYIAGSAAVAAFVATLALEVVLFEPGVNTAAVDNVQVIAIAAVLLLLIAGLISLAVLPGRDPLMLSETNRQAYVYAAQIIAALLFAHLYVCRPLWFDTVLRPYWPFIVMGLAFIGVGSGELFQRYGIRVLAEPLQRTGALLPILPVIGMWVVGRTDEAEILLVVGLLYLAVSFARKSWAAMVAAALAGNGALWAFLVDLNFHFAAHPQFWLIPPALSVLIAGQVNRHRLRPEVLTTIRYAATIVIYVSSTSEIFIRGIGDSLWPPMALLVLAVAGALAGVALRVRAFLFLGTTFTLLALVAMVAHASQAIDHLWPWWVFGIGLGIAILVLFGVFEKKRAEVLQLITRLKQWEQ